MTAIRWTWWHTVAAISLVVLLVIATTGCGQRDDAKRDLPQDQQNLINPEVRVYRMPDGFPNITAFCTEGGTGMYATTRSDDSLIVVADDPACDP